MTSLEMKRCLGWDTGGTITMHHAFATKKNPCVMHDLHMYYGQKVFLMRVTAQP